MSTAFAPLPSAAAVRPASADDPADVRLAACGTDVCVADSGDELP